MKRAPGTRDWAARSEGSRAGMGGGSIRGPLEGGTGAQGPSPKSGPRAKAGSLEHKRRHLGS